MGHVIELKTRLRDYCDYVVREGVDNKGLSGGKAVEICEIYVFIRASIRGSKIAQINIRVD